MLYQAVQTRHGFKNNTFILILKHFQKQVKTLTKNNLKYEAVLQYLNKTLRLNGSIRGTAGRVSIIWYKHGPEPIRLHELSQVFKNHVYISEDIHCINVILKNVSLFGFTVIALNANYFRDLCTRQNYVDVNLFVQGVP